MGRPVGSTTRPQFHKYTSETDRKEFAKWVKANYKKNPKLAVWYGDQMYGKAVQPIGNADDRPFKLSFDPTFDAPTPQTTGNS